MPVVIQIKGLEELEAGVGAGVVEMQAAVKGAMTASVNTVMIKARELAPYKTGTLRRSIYTEVTEGGLRGMVAQDTNIAPYGPMLEFGTAPHDIYPVNKKALYWAGASSPFRHVFHPGISPRPFMMPALQESTDKIIAYFKVALDKVVLTMSGKL